MDESILIVTSSFDVDADVVARLLRREGYDPAVVDSADFPAGAQLTTRVDDSGWSGRLACRGRTVDLAAIRAVWWRKPAPVTAPDGLGGERGELAAAEATRALDGVWDLLGEDPARFWMSHPRHLREASFKIEQMQRAAKLGFEVPRSIVTNDPGEARAFHADCDGRIVYKALNHPLMVSDWNPESYPLAADGTAMAPIQLVSPVRSEHLAEIEGIRHAPGFFQEVVDKSLELRVTVIDGQVFTCGIHSQEDARTRHDWRHYEVALPWTAETLPDDLRQRCMDLLASYGLTFGAFDFVITPGGRYVFLELNPNGQWGFVEDMVPELKLTQCMVETLIRRVSDAPAAPTAATLEAVS